MYIVTILLFGLKFSHRSDKANSVCSQQKLIFEIIDHTLFQ